MNEAKTILLVVLCGLSLNITVMQNLCSAKQFSENPVKVITHDFLMSPPVFNFQKGTLLVVEKKAVTAAAAIEYGIDEGNLIKRKSFETTCSRAHVTSDGSRIILPEKGRIRVLSFKPNQSISEHIIKTSIKNPYYTSVISPVGKQVAFFEITGNTIYIQTIDVNKDRITPHILIIQEKEPLFFLNVPVAVSDDGIVFLDQSESLLAYDVLHKRTLWCMEKNPGESLSCTRLSENGRFMVTARKKPEEEGHTVCLIDTKTGEIEDQHDIEGLIQTDLSKDGQSVLLMAKNGKFEIWNPGREETNQSLSVPGEIIFGTVSSNAEALAVTSQKNGSNRTYIFSIDGNVDTGNESAGDPDAPPRLVVQTGHSSPVSCMAISYDGKLVATTDNSGTIWLWDSKTGRANRKLDLSRQEKEQVFIRAITFNPARQELLILSQPGTFVWPLDDGPARKIQAQGWASWGEEAIILEDGNRIVALADDETGNIRLIYNDIKGSIKPRNVKIGNGAQLSSPIKLSQNGQWGACTAEDGKVVLADARSGKILSTFSGLDGDMKAHAFGNNNAMLASATVSEIMVSDIKNGNRIGHFKTELTDIRSIAVHPQKPIVFAAGGDFRVVVIGFDGQTPDIRYVPWKPKGSLATSEEMIFSPDGSVVFQRCAYDAVFVRAMPVGPSGKPVSFEAHAMFGGQIRFGPGDKTLIMGKPGAFTIWDFENGRADTKIPSSYTEIAQVDPEHLNIFATSLEEQRQTYRFWSPETGNVRFSSTQTGIKHPVTGEFVINIFDRIGFSPKGRQLHFLGGHLQFVYSLEKKKVLLKMMEKTPAGVFGSYAYSPDASRIILENTQQEIVAFDITQGKEFWRTRLPFDPNSLFFTRDGKYISAYGMLGYIALLDADTGEVMKDWAGAFKALQSNTFIPVRNGHCADHIVALHHGKSDLKLFDLSHLRTIHETGAGHAQPVYAVAGSKGDIFIAEESGRILKIRPGRNEPDQVMDSELAPSQLALSSDQKVLSVLLGDGSIMILHTETGKQIARLVEFLDGSWAVVAPDGRYDARNPGEIPGFSWVLADEPFTPRPVEIFYKEYYEPRLLPRLLANEKMPEITPPQNVNRTQPLITIKQVKPETVPASECDVTLEVKNITGASNKNGETIKQESGVFDVKLFRNGQIVGMYPYEGGEVTVDSATGTATVLFESIHLPSGNGARPVIFSAYAFNRDGIKSETVHYDYTPVNPMKNTLRRAYVISIGVNSHDNPSWDLQYAANDARVINKHIAAGLMSQKQFHEVIPITLTSSHEDDAARKGPTKARIGSVMEVLAGISVNDGVLKHVEGAENLKKAGPGDLVIISFSGHGYADQEGRFHLFPSDVGADSSRKVTETLLRNTITSDDLYDWLRDVDAGEMIMVIDACNSAASVEGGGFKPGPMGSRGLGQLAYDKGMRILTATQAENVALESDIIQHGVLTYALVQEGIIGEQADHRPRDEKIMVGEWLKYGVKRVPILYKEIQTGDFRPINRGSGKWRGVMVFKPETGNIPKSLQTVQKPGLFDFAGKKSGLMLKRTGAP